MPTRKVGAVTWTEYTRPNSDTRPRHLHWTVSAGAEASADGMLLDAVTVNVEAATAEEALREAMRAIKKDLYRITSVQVICPESMK